MSHDSNRYKKYEVNVIIKNLESAFSSIIQK